MKPLPTVQREERVISGFLESPHGLSRCSCCRRHVLGHLGSINYHPVYQWICPEWLLAFSFVCSSPPLLPAKISIWKILVISSRLFWIFPNCLQQRWAHGRHLVNHCWLMTMGPHPLPWYERRRDIACYCQNSHYDWTEQHASVPKSHLYFNKYMSSLSWVTMALKLWWPLTGHLTSQGQVTDQLLWAASQKVPTLLAFQILLLLLPPRC